MSEDVQEQASKHGRALSSEFNSWVIGGNYCRNTLKKNQIRADLEMKKKMQDEVVDDYYQKRIEKRREELREARAAAMVTYKSKVQAALREHPTRNSPHRSSPKAGSKSPRKDLVSNKETAEDDQTTSRALRERLKVSFAQTTAAHAYGTLFPPLLTPYNRSISTRPERPSTPPKDTGSLDGAHKTGPQPPPPKEAFSAVAHVRHRIQPVSGPKAFFPTGSALTAYRCFSHQAVVGRPREAQSAGHQLSSVLSSHATAATAAPAKAA